MKEISRIMHYMKIDDIMQKKLKVVLSNTTFLSSQTNQNNEQYQKI